jgi:hypothetical protein
MIGQVVTSDKDGNPISGNGNKLSESSYQPTAEVMELFSRCQEDYYTAFTLQHTSFNEFDGYSLLTRAKMDQETFGAFVGAEYVPAHKRWRWRGRKNTARNRLIGILAHMLAAMLYPNVRAVNENNEEDEMSARVMGILIEDHLRKAKYDMKFLYMVLSALVNPAVFCQVEYVVAYQRVKQQLKDGAKILEVVDDLLSGLQLHIVPIDEILLADFYTFEMQRQPYIIRVRRIPWDEARAVYGKHEDFKYVQAGMTRVFLAGQESQTLYDIQWTEADRNYVQEATFYYRSEDLEVTFVGGVFMGSKKDIYNTNPFKHRRMVLGKGGVEDEWVSVPVYPYAKSGFEPIDPTGRFAYYKSGAFKEYWDDKSINYSYQLLQDGMALDVIKPIFGTGIAKADTTVMIPGAFIGMPPGANVVPYSLGPNLAAAMQVLQQNRDDLSESTQDQTQQGIAQQNVTATATTIAEQNARIFIGVFGLMIANLIEQVGELSMDCIIHNATVGQLDVSTPEALRMKFNTYLARGKNRGKTITNKIEFTDEFMGRSMTEDEVKEMEWDLYEKGGKTNEERAKSSMRMYKVNPYLFARMTYSMYVDADQVVQKSMGNDRQENLLAFQMLTDPRVVPYTDQKAVVDDFVIEKFSEGDPDRYRVKEQPQQMDQMLQAVMGNSPEGVAQVPPVQNQALQTNAQI